MTEQFVDRHGRTLRLATLEHLDENAAYWVSLVQTVVECEFDDVRLTSDEFINELDKWAIDVMNVYLPSELDDPVCKRLTKLAHKIKKEMA